MTFRTPDEARAAVRAGTYPNSITERETVERVDRELFDSCQKLENFAANEGEAHLSETVALVQGADVMRQALRELRFTLEEGTAAPGQATAKKIESLRGQAAGLASDLRRASETSAWHIPRLADPWQNWSNILSRFPALGRNLPL